MSDTNYFLGRGEAWLGKRDTNGNVSDFDYPLPEIEELTISFATEEATHDSKRASLASQDLKVVTKIAATGKMVTSMHQADMLALFSFGGSLAVAGGSFLAGSNAFPSGITAGQRLPIPNGRKDISSLVIKDSAGSPVTLTLNTHYSIEDAAAGVIKFLNVGGFTQPFTAAGTEGAGTKVAMMTTRVYERWLLYKGINVADGDKSCILNAYKVQIDPTKDIMLIAGGNDVNKYEISFAILKDTTKTATSTSSQYIDYKEASIGLDQTAVA
jgi:hypothetical protein